MTNGRAPLLTVAALSVSHGPVPALVGVDLVVHDGETLAVVGESGSGKSTLARAVLGLVTPAAGRVHFAGAAAERQAVFQDPAGSLDPRMTVAESIAEPLRTHRPQLDRAARTAAVHGALARVALDTSFAGRYPGELSGGQCQRAAIARALVLRPRLVVCDEAVSALDVVVRAQVLDLLDALRRETGVALLFIAHDLGVVRRIADRVLVLYLGRVMEVAGRDALFTHSRHPYTRALLDAMPVPDPMRARRRTPPVGEPPSPSSPPSGCVFRTRCPLAQPRCAAEVPPLRAVGESLTACHYAESV